MILIEAIAIERTRTGTLAEARELIDLARAGKLPAVPTHERALSQAPAPVDDMRAGHIVGRSVLLPNQRNEKPPQRGLIIGQR